MKKLLTYFTKLELISWCVSAALIILAFLLFDRGNPLALCASLVGVTSLVFNAKGNPIGQVLMLLFSLLYAVISLTFSYYGEMLTYLGMTAPMSAFSLLSWLKNPYEKNKAQVKINRLTKREFFLSLLLTVAVTILFYFPLAYLKTANLALSTFSVATSFLAAYLTFRRSPYFALAYAANDAVLIALWTLASFVTPAYLSVVVCFFAFLFWDCYGFFSWRKTQKQQREE